jgi:hypothetical protein
VQKVYGYQSCSVGYIHSMLCTEPLIELTTIWLDNIMDGVPPGDVTGCSLSVIVPHHGHLAKWHSTTVFNGGPYFFCLCSRLVLLELST